jgi:hypothetical protein
VNNLKDNHELCLLVLKSLEQGISEEQTAYLERRIASDPEALDYYCMCIRLYVQLKNPGHRQFARQTIEDEHLLDINLWNQLSEYEKTAPIVEKEPPAPAAVTAEVPTRPKSRHHIPLYTAILSMAALILMVVFVRVAPPPASEVATLTDSVDAKWRGANTSFKHGTRLSTRREPLVLDKGFAEILFDNQARIVIEAPAQFEIATQDQVNLMYGRVYASVPKEALGFTIYTQNSKIIDLGTEFGVDTAMDGTVELHVIKGQTMLIAGGRAEKTMHTVAKGKAWRISGITAAVSEIPCNTNYFVRRIDSDNNEIWKGQEVVSLGDLVMGGSGFGTSSDAYANFDPITGKKSDFPYGDYHSATNTYQKITDCPFIDGIFVPNGRNQVVSSEGDVFADCPETTGIFHNELSFNKDSRYFPDIQERYMKTRRLDFAFLALFMHSNLGVTIDLNAIRKHLAGRELYRFRTTAGTAYSISYGKIMGVEDGAPASAEFDVWITVDGRLRAKAGKVRWDSLIDLDVPLTSKDRFLSILVTDGGTIRVDGFNANHYDLCLLGDSRFEVESAD